MPVVPFLDLAAAYQALKAEIDTAVARVLASGHYILGEEVEAFEAEWAAYCEAGHAVGVGNGLDALVLALRALGLGPGDEVIVPAHTFIATWLAVTAVGARIVPVDVTPDTGHLDPAAAAAAITPRTRAILPVHLYGQPADLAPLLDLAARHGLALVEDAAQAHGARYRGRRIGAHGHVVCWSFYPGKNLGALGDAGAVTTNDGALAHRVRLLRNYGSAAKYEHLLPGVNSRLDPLQAAILRVKLRHLDDWNAQRTTVARRYEQGIKCRELSIPQVRPDRATVWHLYVVRHPRRDALRAALAEHGIETLIHYPTPPYRQPAYQGLALAPQDFPSTEAWSRTCLSLPMGPQLAPEQIERVIDTLHHIDI
ncbi:MAG: DegT/DnrJ/EryC1/StrS family aminotransferase [Burkholderiales bacterium]|nr:DegT/DnrJ/EryC1/StrS family aminotransferase [Burkholderiales bacterium]